MGKMFRIWPKPAFDAIVPLLGNLQIRIGTIGILSVQTQSCKSNLDIMF